MKKIIDCTLSLTLGFLMFSCAGAEGENIENKNNNVVITDSTDKGDILIVYFSRTGENYAVGNINVGNTAIMADYIQKYTGGTLFEIAPKVPYPDSYEETKTISINETNSNARPAIKYPLENVDKYSIIFIGSPIWYGGPPMIMRTFYETYRNQLATKIIVPFGTHEGSGVNGCTDLLKEYFPNTKFLETFGVRGQNVKSSRESIEKWLQRIGIPKI